MRLPAATKVLLIVILSITLKNFIILDRILLKHLILLSLLTSFLAFSTLKPLLVKPFSTTAVLRGSANRNATWRGIFGHVCLPPKYLYPEYHTWSHEILGIFGFNPKMIVSLVCLFISLKAGSQKIKTQTCIFDNKFSKDKPCCNFCRWSRWWQCFRSWPHLWLLTFVLPRRPAIQMQYFGPFASDTNLATVKNIKHLQGHRCSNIVALSCRNLERQLGYSGVGLLIIT